MTWTPIGLLTAQTNVLLLAVVGVCWVSFSYSVNSFVFLATSASTENATGKEIPVMDLFMVFSQLAVACATFFTTVLFLMFWGGEGSDEEDGGQNALLTRLFSAQCSGMFSVFVAYLLVSSQCFVDANDAAWCVSYFPASAYRSTNAVVGIVWNTVVLMVSSAACFVVTPRGAATPLFLGDTGLVSTTVFLCIVPALVVERTVSICKSDWEDSVDTSSCCSAGWVVMAALGILALVTLHDWARRTPSSGLVRASSIMLAWITAACAFLLAIGLFLIAHPGLVADFYAYTTAGLAFASGISGTVRAFKLVGKGQYAEDDGSDNDSDGDDETQDAAIRSGTNAQVRFDALSDHSLMRRRNVHGFPRGSRAHTSAERQPLLDDWNVDEA